jgi:hypothetical protein
MLSKQLGLLKLGDLQKFANTVTEKNDGIDIRQINKVAVDYHQLNLPF